MKIKRMKVHTILFSSCIVLIMIMGCEYEQPDLIWNPDEKGGATPAIHSVEPDSAYDGIIEIKLIGENFSSVIKENLVHFGTEEVSVQTASKSQLVVLRPIGVSGSLTIQVAVKGAFLTAKHGPYKLEKGLATIGEFGPVNSIAMDSDENLYFERDETVMKVTPEGELLEYGTIDFKSSAMRMGSHGFLYIQKKLNRFIYRIPQGGGVAERDAKIRKKSSYFDFDENAYIYSGAEGYGLMVTSPDGSVSTQVDEYGDLDVKAVRVFEGYVYVATDTIVNNKSIGRGIWKHKILGEGGLEEKILAFDWSNSGSYSEFGINDITFAENGDLYVGTNNSDPILIVHPDGSIETLYTSMIEAPATQLCWGNGKYLYINRQGVGDDDSAIYRVVIGKQGAPYYGRQ